MSTTAEATDASGNEHFLGHVVASERDVQASEDIVAGNGMKLLAKGARIDAASRDRLLQHKLGKPLEQSVVVADAIGAERLVPIAEKLLDEHAFLRELCTNERAQPVTTSLARLSLTPQVQSLLTVYAELHEDRLEHAVAAALLALGLARKVAPTDVEQQRVLLLAGLVHDVGELYIDPALLHKGTRLAPEQWKHIVAHPVIGHRVLLALPGAGKAVAEAVLHHHERLDGFGYPNGLAGNALPIAGQILAAAEWLAALTGSGRTAMSEASVVSRLMPGQFHASIVQTLIAAAKGGSPENSTEAAKFEDLVPRLLRIAGTMERYRLVRPWIAQQIAAGTAVSPLLEVNNERMERIKRSFATTGLAGQEPQAMLDQFKSFDDPALHAELRTIVHELEWRLRELERDSLLQSARLPPAADQVMRTLIAKLRGAAD